MRKTTNEKIQAGLEKRKQIDNQIRQLQQRQKAEERKARTKRLIERGAIAESLLENPANLTNEEFKAVISNALTSYKHDFPTPKSNSTPALISDEITAEKRV